MNHNQYRILIYIVTHLTELPKVRTKLTFIVAYCILFSILFWKKGSKHCTACLYSILNKPRDFLQSPV